MKMYNRICHALSIIDILQLISNLHKTCCKKHGNDIKQDKPVKQYQTENKALRETTISRKILKILLYLQNHVI